MAESFPAVAGGLECVVLIEEQCLVTFHFCNEPWAKGKLYISPATSTQK